MKKDTELEIIKRNKNKKKDDRNIKKINREINKIKKDKFKKKFLNFIKNNNILDFLSKNNRHRPKIVAGFSAETKSVIKNTIQKMKNKNCDIIFENDVSQKNIGFNYELNKVSMID